MAANPLPQAIDDLMTLAEDVADGAAIHETAVGLLQNTETAIRADAAALQTAQTAHLAAQATKRTLYAAQKSADNNARAFIRLASSVLGNYLGNAWTGAWAETGFPNQSTAVPGTVGERQALLASLQTYFTNHAAHENGPLNVTAAQAGTLFTALSDARSAVNNGLTDTGQKRVARNAAQKKLTKRLGGLIGELDQLLEGNDPRWLAFGLNMPSAAVTPEAPRSVVLTLGAPGEVLADSIHPASIALKGPNLVAQGRASAALGTETQSMACCEAFFTAFSEVLAHFIGLYASGVKHQSPGSRRSRAPWVDESCDTITPTGLHRIL